MKFIENLLVNPSGLGKKTAKSAKKKLKLLKAVYELDNASVNDLMKSLTLSFPTLNNLMVELVSNNYLTQHDRGESLGGRKPNLYQLTDGLFKVLTIEINRKSIRFSVVDNNSIILFPAQEFPFELSTDIKELPSFLQLTKKYIKEQKINLDQISGISISMPGLVDRSTGENFTYFYEPGFILEKHIEHEFNKPTKIINDAKVATLAEQFYGKLKKKNNALVISLDWGISLGIVANGEIYLGKDGFSGEMGHISFINEGELCYCGKRGCLETLVSGTALVNKAKQDIENGTPTLIVSRYNNTELTPEHIIQAAMDGDQYAIQLISELGGKLGRAISLLMQLFNPETIVLSGSFARSSMLMITPIQQQIQTYSMSKIATGCSLQVSNLCENGQAFALARHFINTYFEDRIEMN
ncbi:ROK family protein [Sphingobacterium sp. WM]|uniref:ROK family protein n=1 Tax=Sphingobacterium sp. WM TaxID=3031802 RepID=UPI00240E3E70|nr:ROK family protein [Sphingobacterium sp. WM]WFB62410.1 ROK family protein [Sphingobacterium sp. WM]